MRSIVILGTLQQLLLITGAPAAAFSSSPGPAFVRRRAHSSALHQSSVAADGSEYSADKSDFDDEEQESWSSSNRNDGYRDDEDETPSIELKPVPISKNAGNRFVAVVWDRQLQKDASKDALDLHYDRIELTEDHVMFCRKQNLYNETFNTESMVDIPWSLPMYVVAPSERCAMLSQVFSSSFRGMTVRLLFFESVHRARDKPVR